MKLPAEILDDRIAIVGTAGSGKTVTGKLGVEALLDQEARVCVVDPLGVWWGLRSNASGDRAAFAITIFGGEHGDLPISENAGGIVAEAIATGGFSCIVDLSDLGSQAKRRKFMKDFAETLYAKNREPLHLVLDEADLWCPQKPIEDIAHILGARIDEIVRRGRVRGFVPWLISQRPAVIHKDVLSQLDTLIAMKLTSSQDRNALDAWIEGQAEKSEQKRIYGALPSLAVGEGILWSPGHSMLKQVRFSMIRTFDSSRTPKRGERIKAPSERAAVDLEELRSKLATVEQQAAENDPKALRKRIAELERQVGQQGASQEELDAAHGLGVLEGEAEGFKSGFREARDLFAGSIRSFLASQVDGMQPGTTLQPPSGARAAFERAKAKVPVLSVKSAPLEGHARQAPSIGKPSALPKGELATLKAIAQYPAGATREQLSVLTGYKRSSRDAYIQRLKDKGFVGTEGGTVVALTSGIDALGSDYANCRLKPGLICPHRGAHLGSMPVDQDGNVVCPMHGLKWNVATGELVRSHLGAPHVR